jgi:hypothetical protein
MKMRTLTNAQIVAILIVLGWSAVGLIYWIGKAVFECLIEYTSF